MQGNSHARQAFRNVTEIPKKSPQKGHANRIKRGAYCYMSVLVMFFFK